MYNQILLRASGSSQIHILSRKIHARAKSYEYNHKCIIRYFIICCNFSNQTSIYYSKCFYFYVLGMRNDDKWSQNHNKTFNCSQAVVIFTIDNSMYMMIRRREVQGWTRSTIYQIKNRSINTEIFVCFCCN